MTLLEVEVALEQHDFACPVCGRVRPISERAARAVRTGARSGICKSGEGCQAAIDKPERLRRWWLHDVGGVPSLAIAAEGGACGYVARHGLPDPLGSLVL